MARQVPIVVIAEDGITSQRYYVIVTRDLPPATAPSPGPSPGNSNSSATSPEGSPLGAPAPGMAAEAYSSLATEAALVSAAAQLAASPAEEISGVSTALLAAPTVPQYSAGPLDVSELQPGANLCQIDDTSSYVLIVCLFLLSTDLRRDEPHVF